MRLLIAIVSAWVMAASAMAQGLPQAVADAYRGYEAAVGAEDWVEAARQAELAWRAAEDSGVATETTTILAANFGEVAMMMGNHSGAAEAYERAADLMGRQHEDVVTRANYLRLAAQAHYSLERYRRARNLAADATDLFESLPASENRSGGIYYSEMIRALAVMSDGSLVRAGQFALRAMEALDDLGAVQNQDTATLTFLAGINQAFRRDKDDAAYYFTLSSYINDAIGSGYEASEIAQAWARYIRGEMSARQRAALLQRLRDSGYAPAECSTNGQGCYQQDEWMAQFSDEQTVVDAVPIERRPPEYPNDAALAGVPGFALLRYTVLADGSAADAEVIFSVPVASFGEEAERILRRWEFNPATVDGVPVDREGYVTNFEYVIAR